MVPPSASASGGITHFSGLRLEELEAPAAKERQREGQEKGRANRRQTGSSSHEDEPATATPDGPKPRSRTNAVVAEALGISETVAIVT